jgi:predicted SprT family Zn-dependent metalloprotease
MPECRNCGGHVTARFRRVFGDNDGEVWGCRECMGSTEIVNGGPAGAGDS